MKNTETVFHCKNPRDTADAAKTVAKALRGRETVAFRGTLGAGKTTFIRALCAALGVRDEVTSPTFTLVNEYTDGPFPIYHFDMYRVESEADLFSTGYYDYLETGVLLIEWSEKIEKELPAGAWRVEMRYGREPEERIIRWERTE